MFERRSQEEKPAPRVMIAAAGTGGHLYPAQALAAQLLSKKMDVLFVGKGLKTNRCFHSEMFSCREVASATIFGKGLFRALSPFLLIKGIFQSLKLISGYRPDLLIGFGSFYSFPILLAALLKKIPYVLFEPNCLPGKVNRLFSRWAVVSAIQFSETAQRLSGLAHEVKMPLWKKESATKRESRSYFGLDPSLFTFLIFGGSQGAHRINALFCSCLQELKKRYPDFQVIHITGSLEESKKIENFYASLHIPAAIKEFEEKMTFAWTSADLAICRAGSGTLAEQIAYEVPGILIPFPHAADQHQKKNASFMAHRVQGAIDLAEKDLDSQELVRTIDYLLSSNYEGLKKMKSAISAYKNRERKELFELIADILEKK